MYKNEILTLEENVFDHEFDMSMEDSIISETDKKSSSSCLWGGKGIPGKSARALIVLQDSAEQRVKKKKKKNTTLKNWKTIRKDFLLIHLMKEKTLN